MLKFILLLVVAVTPALVIGGLEKPTSSVDSQRAIVCTAHSLTGKRFSATGTDKMLVQDEAMRKCQAVAFRCYPTGCKP